MSEKVWPVCMYCHHAYGSHVFSQWCQFTKDGVICPCKLYVGEGATEAEEASAWSAENQVRWSVAEHDLQFANVRISELERALERMWTLLPAIKQDGVRFTLQRIARAALYPAPSNASSTASATTSRTPQDDSGDDPE